MKICLFFISDDMIETENDTLRERVSDLEKKVLEQNDEIICLRSTLADVLRRITQLEGSRSLSTPPLKNGYYRGNHCNLRAIGDFLTYFYYFIFL